MRRWNQAPGPRDQFLLIPRTLDERIPQDPPVRLFGEILDGLDGWRWEQHYGRVAGQPPIHPKIVAGALLYGLTHGIRSSRRLEWACAHAVDFLWRVEGRRIDHSTFGEFRTGFHQELKDVFRQIGRVALDLGLLRLNPVALDGTRVKANSSAHATASAKTLEERRAGLDEQIERLLAEAEEADRYERDLLGESLSATNLPSGVEGLEEAAGAAASSLAGGPGGRRGAEAGGERVAAFGQKPEPFLADSAFATGDNLSSLPVCLV